MTILFKDFNFKYASLVDLTLKNIDLEIKDGEKVLIAGPSGSGKSTLAHCINGLIPYCYNGEITGELSVNHVSYKDSSLFERSKSVGTILQDQDSQFIGLSVGEDVAFAFENECIEKDIMIEEVYKALDLVNMKRFIDYSPQDLSGGQKQSVSLAGVLTTNTDILLFDEPLANLDPASAKVAMKLINDIHLKTNKTIIIIEHRIEDVLEQNFDKIVVMDKGEIIAIDTPDNILATDILKNIGIREPLYIEAIKNTSCKISKDDRISFIENLNKDKFKQPLLNYYNENISIKEDIKQEKMLSLKDIKFSYDKKNEILKGVSFDLYKGEILSLLGNNGAGKSTLSKVITGMNKGYTGDIILNNININKYSIKARGDLIGYVMQNPNHMITKLMIKDEIALGLQNKGYTPEEIDTKVTEVLDLCGLKPYKNWPISALSYGQKKRITIASMLVLNPKVLILDEPTAGQDYKHYTEFMEFIKKLAKQGIAIILITHDMHLALEYSDRSIVLSDGTIIANDKVYNVLSDDEVIAQANLKETSLSRLCDLLEIKDKNLFMEHFINFKRKEL